jgi:hypothetical protein
MVLVLSLVIILSLLTIFIILSLDIGTVKLQDKFFEPASAQGFNNPISGIRNETAESTIPADRSLIVKPLADNLENRLNKSAAILEITGELPQGKNVSASSGLPQSNITVPLYSSASDNNGNRNNTNNMTLLVIWAGGLNLTEFSETIQSLNLTDGERIVGRTKTTFSHGVD